MSSILLCNVNSLLYIQTISFYDDKTCTDNYIFTWAMSFTCINNGIIKHDREKNACSHDKNYLVGIALFHVILVLVSNVTKKYKF